MRIFAALVACVTLSVYCLTALGCGKGKKDGAPLAGAAIDAALKAPESFICDPESSYSFISNVNGERSALDNNGFITRLGSDFAVTELAFIAGGKNGVTLNGPKGMAIRKGTLYVADIDSVRAFKVADGAPVASVDMARMDAKFLNDIAILGETLYVTDTFARKVYAVDAELKTPRILVNLEDSPNGICAIPGKNELVIVTWGPGKILRLLLDAAQPSTVTFFDGSGGTLEDLDGVVAEQDGTLVFSSFTQGRIYALTPNKGLSTLVSGLTSPADIGIDAAHRLLVPMMQADGARVIGRASWSSGAGTR